MKAQGGSGIAVQCDVQDDAAQRAAFSRHMQAWNSLDVAVLNAGIMEKGLPQEPSLNSLGLAALYGKLCASACAAGDFVKSEETAWQTTLDINLRAVLVGAHLATQIMRKQGSKIQAKGASATLLGRSPCLLCLLWAARNGAAFFLGGHSTAAA